MCRSSRPATCAPVCFVRALEIMESCRILRQALTKMPPGEIYTGDDKFNFITGTATSRVEAPRGEVMYSVSLEGRLAQPGPRACAHADLSPTCRRFAGWCVARGLRTRR